MSAAIDLSEYSCPCCDCRVETNHNCTDTAEWYMVKNEIWAEATANRPAQFLCIGCLENRIGRTLVWSDFSDALVNHSGMRFDPSPRLQNRLAGFQFEMVRVVNGDIVQWKIVSETEMGKLFERERELKRTFPHRQDSIWRLATANEARIMTTLQDRWRTTHKHLGNAYNVLGIKLPSNDPFHHYMDHNELALAWDELRNVADRSSENLDEFWQEMALAARNMMEA